MWKRVAVLWTLVRTDARRLWVALRHPAAPTWLKVGAALIVAYVISPIDLVSSTTSCWCRSRSASC